MQGSEIIRQTIICLLQCTFSKQQPRLLRGQVVSFVIKMIF